jgi:hypothetical protein
MDSPNVYYFNKPDIGTRAKENTKRGNEMDA